MKVNFKLTVLTSVIAFVLFFFTALISHADFLRSYLEEDSSCDIWRIIGGNCFSLQ